MSVKPYLIFNGRCEEALEFYKKALDAKVETLMRFDEAPDQSQIKPESKKKIMHSAFRVSDTEVLASDGYCTGQTDFQGFGLALSAKDVAEAERLFEALGEGGQVQAPLTETFFASRFGMVADKFGVSWMVVTEQ
ncbi:MAG: VOC family protein [Methyloligella sp. ZOD6]